MSVKEQFRNRTSGNVLVDALRALLEARTTDDMHAVLVREQSLLVTEAADNMLEALWKEEMSEHLNENVYGPSYIQSHHVLLIACRALGVSRGWQDWSNKFTGMLSREANRDEYRNSMFSSILWTRDEYAATWNPATASSDWIEAVVKIATAAVALATSEPGTTFDGAMSPRATAKVEFQESSRTYTIHRSPGPSQTTTEFKQAIVILAEAWVQELKMTEQRDPAEFRKATFFISGPLLSLADSTISRLSR